MLSEFDIIEKASDIPESPTKIILYYDPVLQDNFRTSISGSIRSFLGALEKTTVYSKLLILF